MRTTDGSGKTRYFVAVDTYTNLVRDEAETIDLYYEDKSSSSASYNEVDATREGSVKIKIEEEVYDLKLQEVDIGRTSRRKPHPIVQKEWDKRIQNIKDFVRQESYALERYVKEDLKTIRTNFFVDIGYSNVVETKLTELKRNLDALDLEVDKLKYSYEHITESQGDAPVKDSQKGTDGS